MAMRDARVYYVLLEGEAKATHRPLSTPSPSLRPGEPCEVEVDGHRRRGVLLPHPDGVTTSATVYVRLTPSSDRKEPVQPNRARTADGAGNR